MKAWGLDTKVALGALQVAEVIQLYACICWGERNIPVPYNLGRGPTLCSNPSV